MQRWPLWIQLLLLALHRRAITELGAPQHVLVTA